MRIAIVALFAFLYCCGGAVAQTSAVRALPHVLVYKTRKDYHDRVPVVLSDDGTKIVSYPAPSDVTAGNGYLAPVPLHNGYWLDKRGISKHTAFLKWTLKEYSALQNVPSEEELMKMVLDKNPVTELCDCGTLSTQQNSVKQLNSRIDKKLLRKKCKVIK